MASVENRMLMLEREGYGKLHTRFVWLICIWLFLSGCQPYSPYSDLKNIVPTAEKDSAPKERIDLTHVPNAVPRYEERTIAGNKTPYKVMGKVYHVLDEPTHYTDTGLASWYGVKFHGNRTSNGEVYDMYGMTAAHATLPIPSYVKVTNLNNQRSIVVRVNDRGPFHPGRIIDLTYTGAFKLGYLDEGTAPVRVEYIDVDPSQPILQQVADASLLNVSVSQASQQASHVVPVSTTSNSEAMIAAPAHEIKLIDEKNGSAFLQVGAFGDRNTAEALKVKLSSSIRPPVNVISVVDAGQEALHKVHIGPLTTYSMISEVKGTLSDMALPTPLLIYKPVN